ncbi:hypothetical protein HK405_009988 [Cladochytrium tenue]|nr:hypothetical protein HK405_009988 [Cladochytrium tenue]
MPPPPPPSTSTSSSSLTGTSSPAASRTTPPQQRQPLRPRIRAGPAPDACVPIAVNDDLHPLLVDSPLATARLAVRVRNYAGDPDPGDGAAAGSGDGNDAPQPPQSLRTCPYFSVPDRRRNFSVMLQVRFRQDVAVDDLMFGVFFDRRVGLPPLAWMPLKAATLIDPAFTHDLTSDRPWGFSPALCAMNMLTVREPPDATAAAAAAAVSQPGDDILGPWEWGGTVELKEDHELLWRGCGDRVPVPKFPRDNLTERRRFFHNKKNRAETMLLKDLVYTMEIFAPFIDFNLIQLNLAGLKVDMQRYLNGQAFHFMFKAKSLDTCVACVKYELV